jgi:hypothetical protein
MDYRLFVNDQRTILVRLWPDGTCEHMDRLAHGTTWQPPVTLSEHTLSEAGAARLVRDTQPMAKVAVIPAATPADRLREIAEDDGA